MQRSPGNLPLSPGKREGVPEGNVTSAEEQFAAAKVPQDWRFSAVRHYGTRSSVGGFSNNRIY
jgi:hypothetical protein